MHEAFAFAIVACLVAAVASLMRGGRYEYEDAAAPVPSRVLPISRPEEQHAS